ncbi:MAG TPA: methyltransferase domain-containing protein [Kiritimatiellia bacterium]|nr:methyltransferase domain-containing protein [Kiritimatiellia bacterium]HMO99021.1 methyltransferase domain-containing protein [Kiritimatiellia bacterium]HMP95908.1 methyltransferase domain-containing protein [Kiritimatiellia bacterium]
MHTTCSLSGKPLTQVIDLGDLYISNFYRTKDLLAPHAPLRIGIGEDSGLLQLMDSVERPPLYRQYWYRSGTNATMTRQLGDVIAGYREWIRLKEGDVVLDIGCNDGTLLSLLPKELNLFRIGIDPAENLAELARKQCDAHAADFFTKERFMELSKGRKARVITSIAMFYGLEDPKAFVADIVDCLADDGIWVLQLSYTPLMIKQNAFDNICHEHIQYYTLLSLKYLLDPFDLEILDVEFNDTNSGSFRVIIGKNGMGGKDATMFMRDIGHYRVQSTLAYEKDQHFNEPQVYKDYMVHLNQLKSDTLSLLNDIAKQGKKVIGYGASTKGNTLLQFYGLGAGLIEAIAERQPQKYGLLTAGSWIPIISEEEMRKRKPDYLFVLPWHFMTEFMDREKAFLKAGGKFIVPLPALQVIQ